MEVTVLQSPTTRTKEEEEVAAGGGVLECAKEGVSGFQSNLELRLGSGGGDPALIDQYQQSKRRCFAETVGSGSGFVDPWSLAARQEKKAVLEQAMKQPPSSMAPRSINPPPPPSTAPAVVGWPPVRSFRRNLGVPKKEAALSQLVEEAGAKLQTENTMDDANLGVVNNNKICSSSSSNSSMFVKVNMEGYAVGRKIDLRAHQGYDSLSRALQKMFHNLLSANYSNKSKQDEGDKLVLRSPNYVLLYEDNEGDKMLVGDVPWEMFISSVKRLYITLDQRESQKCGVLG